MKQNNLEKKITEEQVEEWQSFGFQQCLQYNAAVEQRKDEISRGWGKAGTMAYEHMGCYECQGYNPFCANRIVSDPEQDKIRRILYEAKLRVEKIYKKT